MLPFTFYFIENEQGLQKRLVCSEKVKQFFKNTTLLQFQLLSSANLYLTLKCKIVSLKYVKLRSMLHIVILKAKEYFLIPKSTANVNSQALGPS